MKIHINSRKKKITSLLFMLLMIASFGYSLTAVKADLSQYVETPLIDTSLEKTTMTWNIEKSMGVFAQQNTHPNDKIRYFVYHADAIADDYIVNFSTASWTDGIYSQYSVGQASGYYLIKRDWYTAARDIFAVQDAQYWNNTAQLRSVYTITYSNQMIGLQLINIVTIEFYMNATNYDIIKYTVAEGILLSRTTNIDIQNGTGPNTDFRGVYDVSLSNFSGNFTISFWSYIIWFAIIFVAVLAIIVTLSIVISRRQERLRRVDY